MATSTRTRGKTNPTPVEEVQTPDQVNETVSEVIAPMNKPGRKTPKTKGSDAVILGSFTKVTAAAAPKKKQDRDNPFDEPVADSYKENLEATKEYLAFVTLTDKVDAQCKLIRSAGSFLGIGTAIRVENYGEPGVENLEEGQSRIYFRGQAKIHRRKSEDVTVADSGETPVDATE